MIKKKPIVLITGTSRGIGYGLAEAFLKQNYFVLGCSRSESSLCHDSYQHFILDLTDTLAVTAWVKKIEQEYGVVDILINNTGEYLSSYALLTPVEKVKSIMDVNFFASYHLSCEISKSMMKKKFGRIINISSIATTLLAEGTSAYTASKSALTSFSKVLAKEVAAFGVTCNVISVSIVDTDIVSGLSDTAREQVLSCLSIKRYATISDIYNAISIFASKNSDYITGQVLSLGFIHC